MIFMIWRSYFYSGNLLLFRRIIIGDFKKQWVEYLQISKLLRLSVNMRGGKLMNDPENASPILLALVCPPWSR